MEPLITADALAALVPDGVVTLDASFYLPNEVQDAQALFTAAHIPGAQFFDIDRIADLQGDLPHMLPSSERFAQAAEDFGISNESMLVAYDQRGIFSAARVWWMFRIFGHEAVAVLDGGLPEWQRRGLPLEPGLARPRSRGTFTPRFCPDMLRGLAQMQHNLESREETVFDARSAGRFSGAVPEPRPGMRSGHYPGATSLPFTEMLDDEGRMKDPAALRARFAAAGVTASSRVVTMCGSGVTAAVLSLALARAGLPVGALYDGSWTEWGGRSDTRVETGA